MRNNDLPEADAKRKLKDVGEPPTSATRRGGKSGRQLEIVQAPLAGVRAWLYISDDLEFFGNVAGQEFSGQDGAEVRRQMKAALEGIVNPAWVPVIVVDDDWHRSNEPDGAVQRNDGAAEVAVKFSRGYMAVVNGTLRWCNWDTPADQRLEHMHRQHWANYKGVAQDGSIVLPYSQKRTIMAKEYGHVHFLPYDEAMWAGLQGIESAVVALQERMTAVLASPACREQIAAGGGRLLLSAGLDPKG